MKPDLLSHQKKKKKTHLNKQIGKTNLIQYNKKEKNEPTTWSHQQPLLTRYTTEPRIQAIPKLGIVSPEVN